MTDDTETELAEVQARKNELERQQDHLRQRIKNLRAKEMRLRGRAGRTERESADSAIRRAFGRLEPDEPDGYPRGDVVETALQMAPHHEEADIEDALEGLKRRGEVYEPTEGHVRET